MQILRQRFKAAVYMSNQGHSGHTTVDWLPSKDPSSDFQLALTAAEKLESNQPGQLIFSIMLGTNDSAERGPRGSPVRLADYISNMRSIVNQFLVHFPTSIIVVHHPIWYSTNIQSGALFDSIGLARLKSYLPKIDGLVSEYTTTNPGHVFAGDKLAFDYFSSHYLADLTPESGGQGIFYLHPNIAGAVILGTFWATATDDATLCPDLVSAPTILLVWVVYSKTASPVCINPAVRQQALSRRGRMRDR
jgi:hypothetical protein